jgi:cell division protein ZipA
MDPNLLRFILLVVGILFLFGIYYWDSRQKRNKPTHQAKVRQVPDLGDFNEPLFNRTRKVVDDDEKEPENLYEELEQLTTEVEETVEEESIRDSMELPERKPPPSPPEGEQQDLFGFSAQEESPVDVPAKIIQLNLVAKEGEFSGEQIEQAAAANGLQHGEMQIYHRYTARGGQRATFNMASMVEPGIFPFKQMDGFSTPGVTLFAQLPGPDDSLAIFSDMLFSAERMAASLGGVLQDENHSTLTKQTIENIRSEIMEHRRLVQLARSKR